MRDASPYCTPLLKKSDLRTRSRTTTRYELKAGDKLTHIDGRTLEVTEVCVWGQLSYEAIEAESGETFPVHEQFIAPRLYNTPQDRLLNNQLILGISAAL